MKPTIGRIVHFHHTDGRVLAAIVTAVYSDTHVALTVFQPGAAPGYATEGTDPKSPVARIPHAEEPTPGHWTWPPRA
jgi:hypothetical protein